MDLAIFDFDGVILDSMPTRSEGFRLCLKDFPSGDVERLVDWHESNGGLSRFIKFRYFLEEICGRKDVEKEEVDAYCHKFSESMRGLLAHPRYRILETFSFIEKISSKFICYIASGSEQEELRWLCQQHGLTKHFKGIYGSPTPKTEIVGNILSEEQGNFDKAFVIGDSSNDCDAARDHGIFFFAFNSPELKAISDHYINSFEDLLKGPPRLGIAF